MGFLGEAGERKIPADEIKGERIVLSRNRRASGRRKEYFSARESDHTGSYSSASFVDRSD